MAVGGGGVSTIFWNPPVTPGNVASWFLPGVLMDGGAGGTGTLTFIQTTPPVGPAITAGMLWFNSNNGQLYVYYDDGSSQQWVSVSNDGGGDGVGVAVSDLPTAGYTGRRAFVTDATVTTFGTVVAGGGSNGVPVYDDGIVWRIG
jgi:hypothetical protein